MDAALPALVVVVPLVSAIVVALTARVWRGAAWPLAVLATAFSAAGAIRLLVRACNGEIIVYLMGGWPVPTGIPYRVDLLNAIVLPMVLALMVVTSDTSAISGSAYSAERVWNDSEDGLQVRPARFSAATR